MGRKNRGTYCTRRHCVGPPMTGRAMSAYPYRLGRRPNVAEDGFDERCRKLHTRLRSLKSEFRDLLPLSNARSPSGISTSTSWVTEGQNITSCTHLALR